MHEDWTLLKKLIWLRRTVGGAAPILKTVKGALLHITDALAKPAHELVAVLKPVQDLHGYDAPWPAGGGKNAFPSHAVSYSESGVTFTANSDGIVTVNGTATAGIIFTISEKLASSPGDGIYCHLSDMGIVAGNSYILNGCPSAGNTGGYRLQLLVYGSGSEPSDTGTGSSAFTFSETDVTEKWYRLAIRIYNGTVCNNLVFKPMIRLASVTDATYAPYSNECPISGWTGANITGAGKNLFNPSLIVHKKYIRAGNLSESSPLGSEVDNNSFDCSDYVRVKPSTQYTTCVPKYMVASAAGLVFYSSNTVGSAISGVNTSTQGGAVYTFTTPANCNYIRFSWDNRTPEDSIYPYPMLTQGTDTVYEAYKSTTLPINWQTEAGTVYGGTVTLNEDGSADVVSSVSRKQVKDLSWSYYNTVLYAVISDAKDNPSDTERPICEQYSTAANVSGVGDGASWPDNIIRGNSGTSKYIYIKDTRYTTASGFKSAEGELWLYYTLATPQTYHFDNVGQLQLFLGENNIWVDASDDLTLTYYADGNASDAEALGILLGGMYSPGGDVSDQDALNILLGG